MNTPRPEYPRPQCVRDEWLCLNGELTDVFQEQNGLFTFERALKFDPARLRAAQCRPAP